MAQVVLLLVVVGPMLLQAMLFRTRWRFVPGVLLLVGSFAVFASIQPVHDDVGGIGAMGNGVAVLAAIGLGIYGFLMLIFGAAFGAKRAELASPAPLPTATVVDGVTKA